MKKGIIFCVLFLVFGAIAYSQTWAIFIDNDWDIEFTVITQEQFNRIVTAQETTANFAMLEYFDEVQAITSRVTRGSRPNFNGFYYLSIRLVPKTNAARNSPDNDNLRAWVRYGNTRIGFMEMQFLSFMGSGAISLRFNRSEYIRQKNQLIRLVNGE